MKKNYDVDKDLICRCEKVILGDITIYIKDGIRYINKPNILVSNINEVINYDENINFNMKNVKIILKQLGLSQTDLANQLGLTRKAISKYKVTDDPWSSTVGALRNALYKLSEIRTEGKLYLSMTLDELFYN